MLQKLKTHFRTGSALASMKWYFPLLTSQKAKACAWHTENKGNLHVSETPSAMGGFDSLGELKLNLSLMLQLDFIFDSPSYSV